ncbi:hypothetical protein RUMHYD_03472 [Blautia hydrogenotrophica DSM 10507]|uniref:Uncharacterized protein n=1 Tax=Blautia hydrogenotrophica (strain DSM 10507 / JCM 14656 / S5a33) TaxID=476272 RepID=C0CRF8_BLAHS|nr:hypothetical protein RUMHYD_03472 [Blautia hydrogenotrophica DSM 10507]
MSLDKYRRISRDNGQSYYSFMKEKLFYHVNTRRRTHIFRMRRLCRKWNCKVRREKKEMLI